jgi:predicted amino acid dehydrogenase
LLNLQEELSEMSPQTKVRVTTQPDRFAPIADVIIISTSAIEGNVLSIDRIKPGCVVCDVSRPLTYSAVQATTRPDILIVESGEIELPGQVKVSSDIGLPHPIVYACLAETALLALEGRFESFTLSRNIYYKKVKEIYKIARKHGARLAAIRSPTGLITEQEINLCREHAVEALRTWGKRVQSD